MSPALGPGLRWALLPLLCALLGCLTGGVLCCQQGSVCGRSCCQVEPNCSAALHVVCHCPDISLISLQEGDIPDTVESVSISGARKVTIQENAVRALASLMMIRLHNIDSLELRSGGLTLLSTAKLRSLQIENVTTVNISDRALSGVWDSGTEVKIRAVAELHVERGGFSYRSAAAPSVSLDHILLLDVASNGLTAPIRELTLAFVNMTSCNSESFSENITRIDMRHVNIVKMEKWCIKSSSSSTKLEVKTCNIGAVHSQGISGKFSDVAMDKTNITTVQENGLMVQIATMHVTDSHITELRSNGMNVSAKNSVHLSKLRVGALRRHGLKGLVVANSTSVYLRPFRIHNLEVRQADEGSLTFAKGVNVSLFRINIHNPEPPMCPTEKWVRWLSGKGEKDQMNPTEHEILRQLHQRRLCGDRDSFVASGELSGYSQESSSEQVTSGEPPQAADGRDVSREKAEAETAPDADVRGTLSEVTAGDKASETSNLESSQKRTSSSVKIDKTVFIDTDPAAVVTGAPDQLGPSRRDGTGTRLPADGATRTEAEHSPDGRKAEGTVGGVGDAEPTGKTPGTRGPLSPSGEEQDLRLRFLQLTRRLEDVEHVIYEIRAQNGSRTLWEIVVVVVIFTACAFYFVFKTHRWMDRRADAEGRSRRRQSEQSEPLQETPTEH